MHESLEDSSSTTNPKLTQRKPSQFLVRYPYMLVLVVMVLVVVMRT